MRPLPEEISKRSIDLNACDTEPIHVPGSIQPHGFLLVVLGPDLAICQASENAPRHLSCSLDQLLKKPVLQFFLEEDRDRIRMTIEDAQANPAGEHLTVPSVSVGSERTPYTLVVHESEGAVVLEFEPEPRKSKVSHEIGYRVTNRFLEKIRAARDVAELAQIAAVEIRSLTGFDRVLVYRFDEDGHGLVLGEDRNDLLPSYLNHRFPASDIPRQARQLYLINRLRLIANANYEPVPLQPALRPDTGRPLDMTHSVLRSVSPIHVEYMRNMGTLASMSISIVRDDVLWGLISCHHHLPTFVSPATRLACDLIGQVLSLQLAATEHRAEYERRIELKAIQAELLKAMISHDDYRQGLCENPALLLSFAAADGAAMVSETHCRRIGTTPEEHEIRQLVALLDKEDVEIFHTASLSEILPAAKSFAGVASGVLAIAVSKLHSSYVIWFRPEVVQTTQWAGEPAKAITIENGQMRLHPRKSFETWRETVGGTSLPFRASELNAAVELRNAIVGIVLHKAEVLADLNEELERSNRELEAFSYSVSHDLRAPFRHIVGFAELLREHASERLDDEDRRYLRTISESAEQAGRLVDNLLAYSRMGRQSLDLQPVNLNEVVDEIRALALSEAPERRIAWQIETLPRVACDVMMLRLALYNLFSNAIKYTRNRDLAQIEIRVTETEKEHVFSVRDNGVGFDMRYADKLFGVFQRMHRIEDYEGTGIGLANVRRIIARHGGRTWAQAEVNQGTTIYFTLPKTEHVGRM